MDWIVSFNTSGTVLDDYMVSGIPTFFVVDPDGRISWSQVGYAEEYRTIFLDQLKTIFPEDTVNPVIEEVTVTSDTEISIFYPEIAVYANVTDNWRATGALLILDNGDDEVQYDLNLKLMDGYQIINQNITLDPLLLYGHATVNVKIKILDHYENSVTETIALGLTEYVDTGSPVINAYSYNVTQVDESKFNVEVFLDVTEDLLIVEANLYIYKGTTLKKTAFFAEYNATHMKATVYSMFYVDGQPTEYSIKIEVIDAVGNVAEIEVMIEEAANSSSFGTLGIIISAILVIGLAFRKRKR